MQRSILDLTFNSSTEKLKIGVQKNGRLVIEGPQNKREENHFFTTRLTSCGTHLMWDSPHVGLTSCGTHLMWDSSHVGLISCGAHLMWDSPHVGLNRTTAMISGKAYVSASSTAQRWKPHSSRSVSFFLLGGAMWAWQMNN